MNQDVQKILERSGNNLHIDVAAFLMECKWDVDVSAYYFDDTTVKPREIDIVASKTFNIDLNPFQGCFKIILFIECKNFQDELIFRTQKNNATNSFDAIITSALNKQEVFTRDKVSHHYLSAKETTILYDTTRDQENRAFNAITQPIKALTHFKEGEEKNSVTPIFYYPLTIVNNKAKLFTMRGNREETLKEVSSTIVGLNYSYRNISAPLDIKKQYFCIDFIKYDNLEEYLEIINDNAIAFKDKQELNSKINKNLS